MALPSLKAKRMLTMLCREPLAYEIKSQKGSHRKLASKNGYPPLRFWAHDGATLAPGVVREILVKRVGLTEEEAHAVIKG